MDGALSAVWTVQKCLCHPNRSNAGTMAWEACPVAIPRRTSLRLASAASNSFALWNLSVSGNHLFDRRVRSGQFQENKLEGHSDQRKTFVFGRRGKSELTEHDTIGFNNQFAAINESSVEIKDHELHGL